jgi:hypothetical protein
MVNGYAMSVPKKLEKLFSTIGMGSLKAKSLLIAHPDGTIEHRPLTEKDAAKPCNGELWVEFEILWGHFNGPKKKYRVLTDGEIIKIDNWILPDGIHQVVDPTLEQYIREQLDEIF